MSEEKDNCLMDFAITLMRMELYANGTYRYLHNYYKEDSE